MDSKTDVPIILTEDFANNVAKACVEVIVAKGKLTKKKVEQPAQTGKLHRVQVGAFANVDNAKKLQAELKAKGYDAIIV